MKPNRSKSKKIYEQVAEHIKAMIEQGHLQPGDKLPPMFELAKQFGVSRATVREAFSSLVGMGLIDLRHGEGTFVQKIDVQTMITEPMNAAILLGRGDLQTLLDVRGLLETGVVRWACQRADEQDLIRIREVLAHMDPAQQHLEELVSADVQFHLALAEAAGNNVLLNLMNTLSEAVRSLLRISWTEQGAAELYEQHRRLYEAIAARDEAEAERLITEHLAGAEAVLRQLKEKRAEAGQSRI